MKSDMKMKRRMERQKISLLRFIFILIIFFVCSFYYFNMKSDSFTSENVTNTINIKEFQKNVPSLRPPYSNTYPDIPNNTNRTGDHLITWNLAASPLIQYGERLKLEEYQDSIPKEESKHNKVDQQMTDSTIDLPVKTVYLTFDDGPNEVSEQIMSVLNLYGAKATFFLIDGNIRKYPDTVKKMIESGHSVGSHSVSHSIETFYQSPETVIAEMNQVRNTIKEITGIDSMLIRTPYGSKPHMTDDYQQAVISNGYIMWDWNIDSKDWYFRDYRLVENVIQQVENQLDSPEPLVILLHERTETALQLPALLQYLESKNCIFKAIDHTMDPVAFK